MSDYFQSAPSDLSHPHEVSEDEFNRLWNENIFEMTEKVLRRYMNGAVQGGIASVDGWQTTEYMKPFGVNQYLSVYGEPEVMYFAFYNAASPYQIFGLGKAVDPDICPYGDPYEYRGEERQLAALQRCKDGNEGDCKPELRYTVSGANDIYTSIGYGIRYEEPECPPGYVFDRTTGTCRKLTCDDCLCKAGISANVTDPLFLNIQNNQAMDWASSLEIEAIKYPDQPGIDPRLLTSLKINGGGTITQTGIKAPCIPRLNDIILEDGTVCEAEPEIYWKVYLYLSGSGTIKISLAGETDTIIVNSTKPPGSFYISKNMATSSQLGSGSELKIDFTGFYGYVHSVDVFCDFPTANFRDCYDTNPIYDGIKVIDDKKYIPILVKREYLGTGPYASGAGPYITWLPSDIDLNLEFDIYEGEYKIDDANFYQFEEGVIVYLEVDKSMYGKVSVNYNTVYDDKKQIFNDDCNDSAFYIPYSGHNDNDNDGGEGEDGKDGYGLKCCKFYNEEYKRWEEKEDFRCKDFFKETLALY